MTSLKKLLEKIEVRNRQKHLFRKNDVLVLGASGGPDSMALLALFLKLRRKYSLKLVAAHLNHGLSLKAGRQYQNCVKKFCEREDVPFYSKSVSVKKISTQHKRSLEETGREARYQFFESVARRVSATKIVTAHTLDDQAETVLMWFIRGAGLKGLSGIPSQRPQGVFQVIRPLLSCEKEELVQFLKDQKIAFCKDLSNRDPIFFRNKIRHQLLPYLVKSFNPQMKQAIESLQSICEEAHGYIDRAAERAFKRALRKKGPGRKIVLRGTFLKKLPRPVLQEVVMKTLLFVKNDFKRHSFTHVTAVLNAVFSPVKTLEIHLPGFIVVRKTNDVLEFHPAKRTD